MPLAPRKLRIGLLIDSFQQPLWVAKMLEEIVGSDYAEISLLIVNDRDLSPAPVERREVGLLGKLAANREHLLYTLYNRLEAWRGTHGIDAFEPVFIGERFSGCPTISVQPRMTKFCDYFEDADVDAILEHDLDVALRLGFRILKGRALEIARFGIWSYHHGDNLSYRGGPAGFWEVAENRPITGSILQVLTEQLDNGAVLDRLYARTNRMSVRANRNNLYWKTAALIPRKLRELHEHGTEVVEKDPISAEYRPYSSRLYTKPTNRETASLLGSLALRRIRNRVADAHSFPQWFVAFKLHGKAKRESSVPDATYYNFRHIVPPPDRFWADPFPVLKGDRYHIFVEELPYATNKGHIAVLELDRQGKWGESKIALELPYHLSYPFLFEWKGGLFMIPETAANRTVEVYRCADFPDGWELVDVLLDDVYAVDATLAEIEGRWWMFLNKGVEGALDRDDELHIYHAPSPLGPWQPHRRNPVKTDVRSARPGGRLFRSNGDWYRPAQDGSERYGWGMTVNKILHLSETDFREEPVGKILPEWTPGLLGTHTLNAAPGLTVIDGLRRRSKFR